MFKCSTVSCMAIVHLKDQHWNLRKTVVLLVSWFVTLYVQHQDQVVICQEMSDAADVTSFTRRAISHRVKGRRSYLQYCCNIFFACVFHVRRLQAIMLAWRRYRD